MAHDWPDMPETIKTVREFLQDLAPRLGGQDRYHALCAVYLLDIAGRELGQWAPRETDDDRRLRALAGADAGAPMPEVVAGLCRDIRAGKHDGHMDALLDELLAHVVAKVEVAKPANLAAEHRRDEARERA